MASAWGVSWGSAWGNSWGAIGAVVDGRGGDDAPPRRRARTVYIYPEPEAPAEEQKPLKRRKVTAKAVRRALATADDLRALLSTTQAIKAAPAHIEYRSPPNTDLSDDQLFIRALVEYLRIEAEHKAALADEELAIVLALAA